MSHQMSGAKADASENTTNMARSIRKAILRPIRSDSGPMTAAPTIAPRTAALVSRPVSKGVMLHCATMSGEARPMMKKSKPSSMMPIADSHHTRRCIGPNLIPSRNLRAVCSRMPGIFPAGHGRRGIRHLNAV